MRLALILSLLIALVAVAFAFSNPDVTTINLIWYEIRSPLAVVLIVTLLAGLLIGTLGAVPARLRHRAHIKRLEKRIAELESSRGGAVVVEERVEVVPEGRPSPPPVAGGAAETERLAADTARMAEEARRRAEGRA